MIVSRDEVPRVWLWLRRKRRTTRKKWCAGIYEARGGEGKVKQRMGLFTDPYIFTANSSANSKKVM